MQTLNTEIEDSFTPYYLSIYRYLIYVDVDETKKTKEDLFNLLHHPTKPPIKSYKHVEYDKMSKTSYTTAYIIT